MRLSKPSVVLAFIAAVSPVYADGAAATKANELIDKGLAYLKTQQQPDGGWQKSAKEPVAITAIALRPFVRSDDYSSKTDLVARGFEKLLSFQTADGGIYKDLLASYNTAIAASTLASANDPAMKPQLDKAVGYLKRLQWTQDTKPDFVSDKEKNNGKQVVKDENRPVLRRVGLRRPITRRRPSGFVEYAASGRSPP